VQKVTFVVSTILDLELWIYFGFCFLDFELSGLAGLGSADKACMVFRF
jgi:hypothetical protein